MSNQAVTSFKSAAVVNVHIDGKAIFDRAWFLMSEKDGELEIGSSI